MNWLNQASTSAQKTDAVFFFVLGLSVFFLLFITGMMVYFVIRYARKRHPRAAQIEGHTGLEIVWTVVPLVIFLAIFYYGWTNFDYIRSAPRDAMVVKVTGRQWSWSFEYPNGKQTQQLYAVLHKPTKLELRSADVIHGFFIPAFRLKIDAVPGMTTTTWFEPILPGAYDIECTVICGAKHAAMLSKVVVVPEEEFKAWYFGDENAPEPGRNLKAAAPAGEDPAVALLRAKTCLVCHSLDGKTMVGPTFKGMMGRTGEVMTDGRLRTVTVDEAYLRRAIQQPMADVLKGYPPSMPGTLLTEAELDRMVAHIASLK